MKEKWVTPKILVEEFLPNDYVSVCYSLKCQVGTKGFSVNFNGQQYGDGGIDLWEWDEGQRTEKQYSGSTKDDHNTSGTAGTCNDPASNYIFVDDAGNYSFYEESHDQGTLQGLVTNKVDKNGDGKYGVGDLFAWVTYNTDNFWRHWAYGEVSDPSHPNRS